MVIGVAQKEITIKVIKIIHNGVPPITIINRKWFAYYVIKKDIQLKNASHGFRLFLCLRQTTNDTNHITSDL